jgi:hypothetical protein
MEIVTPKATRRSTRLRVEIPLKVTSLDRKHPFCAECVALVVSLQGCGFRASQALPLETPVLLSDLPGGGSASGRVANCLPLGQDGKYFLIGVSLYNHGNVWGIADPPEDWNAVPNASAASAASAVQDSDKNGSAKNASARSKDVWPYNLFPGQSKADLGRK